MTHTVQILVWLLLVIAAVAVVASRLKIPPSILLVIVGVILAAFPGLPALHLEPEMVLLLVLPPVIYDSAVAMSWREFRFNLRPIALLAVGCVVFTTVMVATAAHFLLGMPWAVGFVLGAIVSPPDAVAPLSIIRRLQLPHRLVVVLEGEGLANDATALILYRFAVIAVSLNTFSLGPAVGSFIAIVICEIAWGIGVGWLMLRLRRWVKDPQIEITLSVITPFLAYWPPEHLGGSGVLATVTAGLYISWNGFRLISAATRLQGIFFWGFLIYLIEGMIFLITGLQARTLVERYETVPLTGLIASAAIICAVVIVTRFVWMYPATYIPRWASASLRKRDPPPPWQHPFLLSFTGVRGIVSLAAALAIPLTTASGEPFPYRDLILFLTFSVIIVTLVGQGLLLPVVIRALGLAQTGHRERDEDTMEEHFARQQAIAAALERLERLGAERNLSDDVIQPLRIYHRDRLQQAEHRRAGGKEERALNALHDELELLMIATEREQVNELFRDGRVKDEARRRIERELDLREARVTNHRAEH
ncbi:MAG TPA: Na+/H+ antiporter [Xanthobacteraceae bacterium]|jgi:CPA1 family monovalent cation:H+ antiporter|nr:Na+/H+ antiporter [Xanthobacteraceae bacterium]